MEKRSRDLTDICRPSVICGTKKKKKTKLSAAKEALNRKKILQCWKKARGITRSEKMKNTLRLRYEKSEKVNQGLDLKKGQGEKNERSFSP